MEYNKEFNKEEASSAKQSAITKFNEGNLDDALELAQKAMLLYPQLAGISSLVTVLQVHRSAKCTRYGETDWYGVLGISALADKETISKKYKKMALMVHPDKNHDFNSAEAFRLIQDAFDILKDDLKRSSYDLRMINFEAMTRNMPLFPAGFPTSFPTQAGFAAFPNMDQSFWDMFYGLHTPPSTSTHGAGTSAAAAAPSAPPRKRRTSEVPKTSFWTICLKCNMRFEYPLRVLDLFIRCSKCKTSFLAVEAKKFSTSKYRSRTQNSSPQAGPSVPNRNQASASSSAAPSATPPGNPPTAKKGRKPEDDAESDCKRRKTGDP